jgi:hypothetical protein
MKTTDIKDEKVTYYLLKHLANEAMFTTHNNEGVGVNGTCLQGYINARYDDLVTLFGKPMEGDGYKTDAEWALRFADGTVATIYNWKNGRAYNGEYSTVTQDITEWNVGGFPNDSQRSVVHVNRILELIS